MACCVGNDQQNIQGNLQGEQVPFPFDDFDEAPTMDGLNQHSWVCRAASGSEFVSMALHEDFMVLQPLVQGNASSSRMQGTCHVRMNQYFNNSI